MALPDSRQLSLQAVFLVLLLPTQHAQDCANLGSLNTLVNVTCPNSCSGHGTCDTDTALCACADGWGSDSDLADYKAPDCSLRKFEGPFSSSYRIRSDNLLCLASYLVYY